MLKDIFRTSPTIEPSTLLSLTEKLNQVIPQVPFLVLSYNNMTYIEFTVQQCNRYGITPIILDNHSNCSKTQDGLAHLESTEQAHVVHFKHNYRHGLISCPELFDLLPQYFIYTDPDIKYHPDLPFDFIEHLKDYSERYKMFKVGFDISPMDETFNAQHQLTLSDDVKRRDAFFSKAFSTKRFLPLKEKNTYVGILDTTLALYNKAYFRGNFYKAILLQGPYKAMHMPFYRELELFTQEDKAAYIKGNLSTTTYQQKKEYHLGKFLKKFNPLSMQPKRRIKGYQVKWHWSLFQRQFKAQKHLLDAYLKGIQHTPILLCFRHANDPIKPILDYLQASGLKALVIDYTQGSFKQMELCSDTSVMELPPALSYRDAKKGHAPVINTALFDALPETFICSDVNFTLNAQSGTAIDLVQKLEQVAEHYLAGRVGLAWEAKSLKPTCEEVSSHMILSRYDHPTLDAMSPAATLKSNTYLQHQFDLKLADTEQSIYVTDSIVASCFTLYRKSFFWDRDLFTLALGDQFTVTDLKWRPTAKF